MTPTTAELLAAKQAEAAATLAEIKRLQAQQVTGVTDEQVREVARHNTQQTKPNPWKLLDEKKIERKP